MTYAIVTAGLIGTGKTTVAETLQREMDLDYHGMDALRKELGYTLEQYYQGLAAEQFVWRVSESLSQRRPVIVDVSLKRRRARNRIFQLSTAWEYDALLLECVCPEELSKARMLERKDATTGTEAWSPAAYDEAARISETIELGEIASQPMASLMRFDSSTNEVAPVLVRPGMHGIVDRVTEILSANHG